MSSSGVGEFLQDGKDDDDDDDISHSRHNRPWCTFFKPVYFLAQRMQNLNLFWFFVANVRSFWRTFLQA